MRTHSADEHEFAPLDAANYESVETVVGEVASMLEAEDFVDAEADPAPAEDREASVLRNPGEPIGDAGNVQKEFGDMNEDTDFADAESGSQLDYGPAEELNPVECVGIHFQEKPVTSGLSDAIDVPVPDDDVDETSKRGGGFEDEKTVVENHQFDSVPFSSHTEGNGSHEKEGKGYESMVESLFQEDNTSGSALELKEDVQDSAQLDVSKKLLGDICNEVIVNEETVLLSEPFKINADNSGRSRDTFFSEAVDKIRLCDKKSGIDPPSAQNIGDKDIMGDAEVIPAYLNETASQSPINMFIEDVDNKKVAASTSSEEIIHSYALDGFCEEDIVEGANDVVNKEEVVPASLEQESGCFIEDVDNKKMTASASSMEIIHSSALDGFCEEDIVEGANDVVNKEEVVPASLEQEIRSIALDETGKEYVKHDGEVACAAPEEVVSWLASAPTSPLLSGLDATVFNAAEAHNIEESHGDFVATSAIGSGNLLATSDMSNETPNLEDVHQNVNGRDVMTAAKGLNHEASEEEEVTSGQFEEGFIGNSADKVEKLAVADTVESAVKEFASHSSPAKSSFLAETNGKEKDIDAKDHESMKGKLNASGGTLEVRGLEVPSLGSSKPSLPSPPAGLGRSVPSLGHGPRAVQRSTGTSASRSSTLSVDDRLNEDIPEGGEDAPEKLQMIRMKFLRLAHRLGQSANNVVVAQVLYRLGLAEQLRGGRGASRTGFSFERASMIAEEQEAAMQEDLDFGCTIMVLGKSGVGKSATINSLFDEVRSGTNAYTPATKKVQEILGTVHGIKLRVIDTPGLLTSFADQRHNEKIMTSVKKYIKKSPPDIVLYFDRLDMQTRDYGDLPLLRTITDTFGAAIWFNAIVVLTHASSAPPDGPNGVPVSYEMFVAQRSHIVQQTIRQAAGDMRLMNPVSLVENHAACRTNRAGQRVLPNGQVWKPQLLLLCFSSKILAEANSLLKLQDNAPGKPFSIRPRALPLPFLLSSLLQSRAPPKLPDEQIGDDDDERDGNDLDDSDEEADSEGEDDYDSLPPFRRLTRDELQLLVKEQRKAYFDELEYREKLFMKKQLKDDKRRRREVKRKLAALGKEVPEVREDYTEEENGAASVPVPMPDMALPPSFDSDNPTYRYRYLEATNQWLVRPILETHGWDHDSGYDGLNVEKTFVMKKRIPASLSGQFTKDKKEANVQVECAASLKVGEGKSTMAGVDIQTVGKDLAYTLRSETKFNNFKRNKTTCGLSATLLGGSIATGLKIEDLLMVGRRLKGVVNFGALTGRGNVAYGGSLEVSLRDKDYPIGRSFSTLGLSVMNWHGDRAIGGNFQVQFLIGKTMVTARANLNNRGAGQINIRASSSEQLQMALIGLIPLLRGLMVNKIFNSN